MIRAALRHSVLTLRLYFRNPLALTYGYLFPVVFLLAFWGLYRYDQAPLIRHVGELLTITVLGGACFGLPTALVSERECGVWRRYRLVPIPVAALVVSTIASRYVLVITAGILQVALAMLLGMPLPQHGFQLWVAFTIVVFAFLGCGLVIAMMADTVPAVQALGQTIFLPMLIIGGVAVPLPSLPAWAQHVSAFLPGRYAVEILQACATGSGLGGLSFDISALLAIGSAACLAGAMMFRWDQHERFIQRADRGWVVLAIAAWAAVGVVAEWRGYVSHNADVAPGVSTLTPPAPATRASSPIVPPSIRDLHPTPAESAAGARTATVRTVAPRSSTIAGPVSRKLPTSWNAVSDEDVAADLNFDRLPPDDGIITPLSRSSDRPSAATAESLDALRQVLIDWPPASVTDPVQRARNLLYVAAVADLLEIDLERYAPRAVSERLQQQFARQDLVRILYWIALHPFDGDVRAAYDMRALGLQQPPSTEEELRARAAVYGVKLLGRLTGRITSP